VGDVLRKLKGLCSIELADGS